MIDYKDIIKQAPLPFAGQKRYFVKHLYEYFSGLDYKPSRIVDCFGGSGLLSNLFKQMYPDIEVVYNDYDNYMDRIKRIPKVNEILAECRKVLQKYNIGIKGKITESAKSEIEQYLNTVNWSEVDKKTIYSNFSMMGVGDMDTVYINQVRQSDYIYNGLYCKNCVITHSDYKGLIKNDKSLYILDPPYIQTAANRYKNWFTIADFLKLFDIVKNLDNFVLFTSYRSGAYDIINHAFPDIKKFCNDVLESKSTAGLNGKSINELAYIKISK